MKRDRKDTAMLIRYDWVMNKSILCALGMGFAAMTHGAEPIIDNEHATVWDTTVPLPPSSHDFVAISLSAKGMATFGHQGDVPGKIGSGTIVIELKDPPLPPLANESGYPLAFPRKHVKKLLENTQVVVWDYVWRPGEPTPMHFHDKDAGGVFEATGALKSVTPDGKSVINQSRFGDVRFSTRNRTK